MITRISTRSISSSPSLMSRQIGSCSRSYATKKAKTTYNPFDASQSSSNPSSSALPKPLAQSLRANAGINAHKDFRHESGKAEVSKKASNNSKSLFQSYMGMPSPLLYPSPMPLSLRSRFSLLCLAPLPADDFSEPETNAWSLTLITDLSPGNKLLLGGVLAAFAGISYLMDKLGPEEEVEKVETVFDRRRKEQSSTQSEVAI